MGHESSGHLDETIHKQVHYSKSAQELRMYLVVCIVMVSFCYMV